MIRRDFIVGAAACAAGTPLKAAVVNLGPPTPKGIPRRAWVSRPTVVKQSCPLWCWAASASMIFAAFGRSVPQQQIVAKVFGGLVCAPAPSGMLMAQVLSDAWTDTNGQTLKSNVTAAYDYMAGVNMINNSIIINELANDRPLLYANKSHAMVVVQADYFDTPMGPNIVSVGVLDPWPGSPNFHPLTHQELYPVHAGGAMTFIASAVVT